MNSFVEKQSSVICSNTMSIRHVVMLQESAMDAKLCLCLLLIILGTITVQGARPGNEDNSVNAERYPGKCPFTFVRNSYSLIYLLTGNSVLAVLLGTY